MSDNKTRATDASVEAHLAAIDSEERRRDCATLVNLMTELAGEGPRMWGPSIIGFGSYHYRYASGREGDMCLTGFASRKAELCVYLSCSGPDHSALLSQLGKHKMGKSCLYVKRLADIDVQVLRQLISQTVEGLRAQQGQDQRRPDNPA